MNWTDLSDGKNTILSAIKKLSEKMNNKLIFPKQCGIIYYVYLYSQLKGQKMNCNYLIKVKSVNIVEGDKTENEVITHADFSFIDGGYSLSYKEEKNGVNEETFITVTDGRKVAIKRHAEIETDMTIEEGIRHVSYHKLPFGEFSLDIVGKEITTDIADDGLKLKFSYNTYSGGEVLGFAEFDITLRRKGKVTDKFLREE